MRCLNVYDSKSVKIADCGVICTEDGEEGSRGSAFSPLLKLGCPNAPEEHVRGHKQRPNHVYQKPGPFRLLFPLPASHHIAMIASRVGLAVRRQPLAASKLCEVYLALRYFAD